MKAKQKKANLIIRTKYVPMLNSVAAELDSAVDNEFQNCSDYFKNGVHKGIDMMKRALIVGSFYGINGGDMKLTEEELKGVIYDEHQCEYDAL